jgi:hypothetical protein
MIEQYVNLGKKVHVSFYIICSAEKILEEKQIAEVS